MLDNLEPRSHGCLTTDSPAPLDRGYNMMSRLQYGGYNMMLLIYSKYGWGVYEQGQEQLKRVIESRLMSVSDRLSKCQLPFQCAHGRWVGLTERL